MARRPAQAMKIVPTGVRQYTTGLITPTDDDGFDVWTFSVPNGVPVGSLVEASTVNQSNASCGVYKMYLQRPDKTETRKSAGPQPGCVSKTQVGKWKLFIKTVEPCVGGNGKTYGITVNVRY